jgi:hypothetical protein
VVYVVDQVRRRRQEDVLYRPWGEESLSGKENEVPEKAGLMVRGDLVASRLEAPGTPPANLLEDLSRTMLVRASDEENETGAPAIPVETLGL